MNEATFRYTSTERNCLLVANEIILIIQNKFDRMM